MKNIIFSRIKAHFFISNISCLIISIIFILILSSTYEEARTESINQKSRETTLKTHSYWDDLARFLAGLPISGESSFRELSQSRMYKQHAASMDNFWYRVKTETINLIAPWRIKNFPDRFKRNMAFYPLSGADFINLYMIFPYSRFYLMVALEDPGKIPEPLSLSHSRLYSGLSSIRRSTYLYGRINYFQSKIMIKEMWNFSLKGTTPVIMIFLVRMGLKIDKIRNIKLDDAGKIVRLDESSNPTGRKPYCWGSEIQFYSPVDNSRRKLVYLKMRLGKNTVERTGPAGYYLNSFRNFKTMIKAGCYILHMNQFKEVKEFLLKRSIIIVQDDSGIPYSAFDSKSWNIKLYGSYIPRYPVYDTAIIKQQDLMASFKKGSLPLPFNFGYGSLLGKNKSNLMIAMKK